MRQIFRRMLYAAVLGCVLFRTAGAQQGNLYDGVANPLLFLIREPAVWNDLQLSNTQRKQLQTLNDRLDGPLLAQRNWPAESATKQVRELLVETEEATAKLLSAEQQRRLRQIQLRVRGAACLADDSVAATLELSADQRESIRKTLDKTSRQVADLRTQAQAGKPREPLEQEYQRLRQDERQQLVQSLTAGQKEQLTRLLGNSFDLKKLGKVAFKAPELLPGGEWLNSPPLRLADLRGKVVAVHLWTYG